MHASLGLYDPVGLRPREPTAIVQASLSVGRPERAALRRGQPNTTEAGRGGAISIVKYHTRGEIRLPAGVRNVCQ
jgi:hypothetical protein